VELGACVIDDVSLAESYPNCFARAQGIDRRRRRSETVCQLFRCLVTRSHEATALEVYMLASLASIERGTRRLYKFEES